MSFRANDTQQISMADSFSGLTAREQKALEKSWAKVFAEEVFPAIDEERFSVLYSDKASRPNTPVNVIVGALIIKELFDLSDDEVVENLMLDPRYQYALHTTSFEEQPLSDRTLSRFRRRCFAYESVTGIDLYRDCIKDLSAKIAALMNISGQIRRMDSMMVEANIRRLSRVELIYACIAKMVIYLDRHTAVELPEELKHYLEKNDFNRMFYLRRSSKTEETLEKLLPEADQLLKICGSGYDDVTEYQLLVRCLSEQTVIEDGKRRLRTSKDGGMRSDFLRNPSDPDATFCRKAGKDHVGYAANFEESVGENGSVITDYQVERNTYSDNQFFRDRMESMEKAEETVTIVADGAYSGEENSALAREKNVNLVTTGLNGVPNPDIMADFVFSEDGKAITACPMGHTPKGCNFNLKKEQCIAHFEPECCAQCPHKDECRAKINKKTASVTVTMKAYNRAKTQRFFKTDSFKAYYRLRNGVETLPSIFRNVFHIDRMPRGYQRAKFSTGSKVGALNFRKLCTFRWGRGHYAQNPLIVQN